jgi:putative oxidoreductase
MSHAQRALFIIRMGIGLLYIIFGCTKLIGGMQTWGFLGSQMALFGITFAPAFWGFCAMLSELLGGLSMVMGRYMRYVLPFTMCTMLVALVMHISQGHDFNLYSFPLSMMIILIGLIFSE